MSRPEKPIDYTVPEVGALAAYLRHLKRESGKTYAQLEEESGYSASALKRAARGGRAPAPDDVVAAFARAAGGDLRVARKHFHGAKSAAERAKRNARRSTVDPKPQYVMTRAELGLALRQAYGAAGRPTVRAMAKKGGIHLPATTAHRIVKGLSVPTDVRTFLAFLQACDVYELGQRHVWFAAWARVYEVKPLTDSEYTENMPDPYSIEWDFVIWRKQRERIIDYQVIRRAYGSHTDRDLIFGYLKNHLAGQEELETAV
ncbi:helix-turn-helix domain-containing protein [Streptomyces sp. NBC_00063]|uniref:helix-turn-helix domain-containing protein n=1 Tax=Streptomyces sp. NBC_00063 TaxID=2975638 RepID=UPI003D73E4D4